MSTLTDDPFSANFAWPSPAKLNLFLHVTGRREDGYHLLQSVFLLIDWSDRLSFERRDDGRIQRQNVNTIAVKKQM